MKNKYIIGAIALVAVLTAGVAHAAVAPLTFREMVAKYAGEKIADYFLGQMQAAPGKPTLLGGAFTTGGSDVTDLRAANIIVSGDVTTTNLAITGILSGTVTTNATATIAVSAQQQYFIDNPLVNATSSPVTAIYSGPTVAIDGFWLDLNPQVAQLTTTAWRAYVSNVCNDNTTANTSTLMRTIVINTSTGFASYGGPVGTSIYVSSTVLQTAGGTVSSTPIILSNGMCINVTSTNAAYFAGRARTLVHQW